MYHVVFKGFENVAFEFSPVAFTLFGKEIYWYGVIITVGIILSALYAFLRAKKLGIRIDDMYDYAIFIIVNIPEPICSGNCTLTGSNIS